MFIKYLLSENKYITLNIYKNFESVPFITTYLEGSNATPGTDITNEIMRRVNLGIRGQYVCFEFINNEDADGECRVIGFDAYFKKRVWKGTVQRD
jgi:hypothetical protein